MKIQCIRVIIVICCIAYNTVAYGVTFIPPIESPKDGYCFIQNYVDVNPIRGGQDCYTRSRSFDRHRGTDFRVSYNAMLKGVDVLAAADGKVLRTRDGMDDAYLQRQVQDVEGNECGNGVVIDHGDGWRTQYCHMKKDSVKVKPGDVVKAGSVLGNVGLSGKTEFAHLHFQVTRNGEIVCPFSGAHQGKAFAKGALALERVEFGDPMWQDASSDLLQYVPPQLLKANYSTQLPSSSRDILRRPEMSDKVTVNGKPLVFSVVTAMLQKGDKLVITLRTLGGAELAAKVVEVPTYTAQRYDYVGRTDSANYVQRTLEGIVELWRGDVQLFVHKSLVYIR